jgi:hypothetical protein
MSAPLVSLQVQPDWLLIAWIARKTRRSFEYNREHILKRGNLHFTYLCPLGLTRAACFGSTQLRFGSSLNAYGINEGSCLIKCGHFEVALSPPAARCSCKNATKAVSLATAQVRALTFLHQGQSPLWPSTSCVLSCSKEYGRKGIERNTDSTYCNKRSRGVTSGHSSRDCAGHVMKLWTTKYGRNYAIKK